MGWGQPRRDKIELNLRERLMTATAEKEIILAQRDQLIAECEELAKSQGQTVVVGRVASWKVRQELLELAVKHIAGGYGPEDSDPVALAKGFFEWVRPKSEEDHSPEAEIPELSDTDAS